MTEHQQTHQSKESKSNIPTHTTLPKKIPISHPAAIIQRVRINPKSLTHADVMQLQCTIGNRAVEKLLTEIGLIHSKTTQAPPVQMQMIPEEELLLQGKFAEPIQLQDIPEEEETLQGKFENKPEQALCPSCSVVSTMQKQGIPEDKSLQGKFENKPEQEICPSCSSLPIQREKENLTGMPDNLKAGVENLSDINMSDVRVHYNSDKPAKVGALAYTQGTDIHVAPGQEKHLSHEAWHVVQQAQGRVQPTIHLKDVAINDDIGLEQEADIMGSKSSQKIRRENDDVFLQELRAESPLIEKVANIPNPQSETLQLMKINFIIDKIKFDIDTNYKMKNGLRCAFDDTGVTVTADGIQGEAVVTATGLGGELDNWEVGYIQNVFQSERNFNYNNGAKYRDYILEQCNDSEVEGGWFFEQEKFSAEKCEENADNSVTKRLTHYINDDPHTPSLIEGGAPYEHNGQKLIGTSGIDKFGFWHILANKQSKHMIFLEYGSWEINWKSEIDVDSKSFKNNGGPVLESVQIGKGTTNIITTGQEANALSKDEWV